MTALPLLIINGKLLQDFNKLQILRAMQARRLKEVDRKQPGDCCAFPLNPIGRLVRMHSTKGGPA